MKHCDDHIPMVERLVRMEERQINHDNILKEIHSNTKERRNSNRWWIRWAVNLIVYTLIGAAGGLIAKF